MQLLLLLLLVQALLCNALIFSGLTARVVGRTRVTLGSAPEGGVGEQREAAMSLDELKSELEMRGVDYSECVTKSDLVKKLVESRTLGKANPEVVERFNQVSGAEFDASLLDSDVVKDSVAADGSLPGGLQPELVKALAGDREIMAFLKDPKMQQIMAEVMQNGPQSMTKYLSDPEAMRMLQKLAVAMQRVQGSSERSAPSGPGVRERPDEPDVLQ